MLNEVMVAQVVGLSNQGAAAEEISRELGVDEGLVRLTLRANAAGSVEDRDINDAQLELLRKKAFSLATQSDDDSVAAGMTRFLLERDKPKITTGVGGANIQAINIAIHGASAEFEKLKASYK